jgi:hypothetical protein
MANDNNEIVDIPEIPVIPEGEEDTTDWKAETSKHRGIAQRYQTKSQKLKEEFEAYKTAHPEVKVEAKQSQDKKEFDLAEKTYLIANGIKKDQFQLVFDEMQKSGKSIEDILESPYFKEKLEMEATKSATPSGTKRVGGTARDEVEYWIQKGQLPPRTPENTDLRRKVVAALVKTSENKTKFSSQPIV